MYLIYIISVGVWAIMLIALAFSKKAEYVSDRVFTFLLILSVVPILNTLLAASALCSCLTDSRVREEREKEFEEAVKYLDILIERLEIKIKQWLNRF